MMKRTFFLFFNLFLFFIQPTAYVATIVPPIQINVQNIKVDAKNNQPQKYIVEVESEDVFQTMKKRYPNIKIEKVFHTTFQGAAIIGTDEEILRIKRESGVKQIHPARTYKVELDESVPLIGGTFIRGEFDNKNRRLTGKGVKIGVIDTGIDYTHPDLIRNYRGGFDLVDDDLDPMETKEEEGETTLHGTHVAGIIAANGKYIGVAPDAEIYAYRALGPGGYGTSDQVIAAIEKAVEDGMDIINLSLGNAVNGPDYPTSLALDRAVEQGVIAITSNGNAGPNQWTVGSPGASEKAISVGASTPKLTVPMLEISTVSDQSIFLHPVRGSVPWNLSGNYQLIYGGTGKKENMKDGNEKIVLLENGDISIEQKVKNAYEKGAKAVLLFYNQEGTFSVKLEEVSPIPVAFLSREDALFLKKEWEHGETWVVAKMKKIQDQLATFSSRGPVTHTWTIKPDVVAPGVMIDSTVPGGYIALQGTSMAAPHVAGAAALIKQAHPDWGPVEVKAALMNTAKPIVDHAHNLYNPLEQGAGRIQVDKAIKAEVLAYPSSLTFGSILKTNEREQKVLPITVENKSNKVQKITFTASAREKERGLRWQFPISFYLQPEEKKIVNLSLSIDTKKFAEGIHYGAVQIISTSQAPITLPYIFIIGDGNHPRVMGFSFEKDENVKDAYRYELYLPEGAEELGIALFDLQTFRFIGMLKHAYELKRGIFEGVISRDAIPFQDGQYLAIVYAIENGKETIEEATITIGDNHPR